MEIGIIGFGRFGQFAAGILKKDFRVNVFDRKKPFRLPGIQSLSLSEVANKPILLLCVPISKIGSICREIHPFLTPGQLILDTCSVKEKPLREMAQALPRFVEIVGTHPLFGPDSASSGLQGLKIALCPVRCRRIRKIKDYLEGKGLQVIVTTPEKHDREMAHSQALFHFLAHGVAAMGIQLGPLSTPGPAKLFRDFKDVQNDSQQLFKDLQQMNRFAGPVRKRLVKSLSRIEAGLSGNSSKFGPKSKS